MHYQSKILSDTKALHTAEALVRWQHLKHGMIPPYEFIPLAERTGLIDELTVWVLKKSLEQCNQWHKQQIDIGIAVNVSSRCLLNPEFPDILIGLLTNLEFPTEKLIMEITETSIMIDPERAIKLLKQIHNKGVRLSIDDFGTGYSSLAYLKKLPVNELKIDKSFVMEMLENESDRTIVNATIQPGHNMDLKVVAEGVESQEIFNSLRDIGCDLQQGYFVSRPVPADIFTTWTLQHSRKLN